MGTLLTASGLIKPATASESAKYHDSEPLQRLDPRSIEANGVKLSQAPLRIVTGQPPYGATT